MAVLGVPGAFHAWDCQAPTRFTETRLLPVILLLNSGSSTLGLPPGVERQEGAFLVLTWVSVRLFFVFMLMTCIFIFIFALALVFAFQNPCFMEAAVPPSLAPLEPSRFRTAPTASRPLTPSASFLLKRPPIARSRMP